jgi:hypothetical protein
MFPGALVSIGFSLNFQDNNKLPGDRQGRPHKRYLKR